MEGVDSVVRSVIDKFISRSVFGKQKYGTDLDRTDLTVVDWIQHAQEEQMDGILYLEKLKKEILVIEEKLTNLKKMEEAVKNSTNVTRAAEAVINNDKLACACFGNMKDVTNIVKMLTKNVSHTVSNALFGGEDPVPNVPKVLYYFVADNKANIVSKIAKERETVCVFDNEEVVLAVYGLCVDVTSSVAAIYESNQSQPIYPVAELLGKNTSYVSKTKTLIAAEYVNNGYNIVSAAERSALPLTYSVRKADVVVQPTGDVITHTFAPYKLSNSLVEFVEKNCPQFMTFLLPEVCIVKHKGIQFTREDVALYCQRFPDFTKEFEAEFKSIGYTLEQ